MSLDKLVYMANQIGKFFASQGQEKAAAGTADHIKKFWDPRMRAQIYAHLESGGAGLDPAVREAIERLHEAETKAGKLSAKNQSEVPQRQPIRRPTDQ